MRTRSAAVYVVILIGISGCGGVVSQTFTSLGDAIEPSSPATATSMPAASAPASDGTFTFVNVGAVDGPGIGVEEKLRNPTGEWDLVNGSVLMDLDGTIWFCESIVLDTTPPTCSEPRLRVANWPEGTADWDLSQATITGLKESGGVLYREDQQLVGIVAP